MTASGYQDGVRSCWRVVFSVDVDVLLHSVPFCETNWHWFLHHISAAYCCRRKCAGVVVFLYKSQDVLNCAKFSTFIVQSSFGSGSVLWVWEPKAVYVLSFHQVSRFESCCGLSFTALVCVACGLNVTALVCSCSLWFELTALLHLCGLWFELTASLRLCGLWFEFYCLATFVWFVVWVLLSCYVCVACGLSFTALVCLCGAIWV